MDYLGLQYGLQYGLFGITVRIIWDYSMDYLGLQSELFGITVWIIWDYSMGYLGLQYAPERPRVKQPSINNYTTMH